MTLREVLSEDLAHRAVRLVGAILALTAAVELVGAALLYPMWDAPRLSVGERIYYSVFHSISAFCNAGFGLLPDSFTRYADSWQVVAVIPALIIIGGLGFTVLVNLWEVGAGRLKRWRQGAAAPRRRLGLHTSLVLVTTALLVVAGTALLLALEGRHTLAGQPPGAALRRAFFQSVTARTAGFNTVDISAMSLPAVCVLLVWMFIGASPGSTGGGIKTSTVAVLMANLWATLRRRDRVEARHRTIPEETVRRAVTVASLGVIVVALLVLILTITEQDLLRRGGRRGFEDVCFEVVSAFGTVGLSRGITPELSTGGRLTIVVGMLLGRIGPLTLAMALYGRARQAAYEYPEEGVIIG